MTRSVPKSFLVAVGLLILGVSSGRAADAEPAGAPSADVRVSVETSSAMPHEELRRAEIFRILQGGASVADAALAEHLWVVAGSLARTGWTPPRVTVRVVVKDSAPRD